MTVVKFMIEHLRETLIKRCAARVDLRPLAHGLPAQVIATGTPVRHDLNRHAISILGIDYPDQAIIDECLRGFCDDSQVEFGTLLCRHPIRT